jgi:NADH-quinone oxidoreductase subunit J
VSVWAFFIERINNINSNRKEFNKKMELLFSIFLIFVIYNIISVDSAVTAALFLILLAVTFSMFLFYLNVNFLAILYLAVYIGAVAVFFLFVVMMTDLNSVESNKLKIDIRFLLFSLFFGFLLSSLVAFLIFDFDGVNNLSIDSFNSNIEVIGMYMFNEHSGPFVLIALIILVALIGSIFITFNNSVTAIDSNNKQSQDMEVQLSRDILTSVNLLS